MLKRNAADGLFARPSKEGCHKGDEGKFSQFLEIEKEWEKSKEIQWRRQDWARDSQKGSGSFLKYPKYLQKTTLKAIDTLHLTC